MLWFLLLAASVRGQSSCKLEITSSESILDDHGQLTTKAFGLDNLLQSLETIQYAGVWNCPAEITENSAGEKFIADGATCEFLVSDDPDHSDTNKARYYCKEGQLPNAALIDGNKSITCNNGVLSTVPDCALDDDKKPRHINERSIDDGSGLRAQTDIGTCILAGPGNGMLIPSVDMNWSDTTGDLTIGVTYPIHATAIDAQLETLTKLTDLAGARETTNTNTCTRTNEATYGWQEALSGMTASNACATGGDYTYTGKFRVIITEPYDPAMSWEDVDAYEQGLPDAPTWDNNLRSYSSHDLMEREHCSDYLVRIVLPCQIDVDALVHVREIPTVQPTATKLRKCIRCRPNWRLNKEGQLVPGSVARENLEIDTVFRMFDANYRPKMLAGDAAYSSWTTGFAGATRADRLALCNANEMANVAKYLDGKKGDFVYYDMASKSPADIKNMLRCTRANRDSMCFEITLDEMYNKQDKSRAEREFRDILGEEFEDELYENNNGRDGTCDGQGNCNKGPICVRPGCSSTPPTTVPGRDDKCFTTIIEPEKNGSFTVQDTCIEINEGLGDITMKMDILTEVSWPFQIQFDRNAGSAATAFPIPVITPHAASIYEYTHTITEDTSKKACDWEAVYCYQVFQVEMTVKPNALRNNGDTASRNMCTEKYGDTFDFEAQAVISDDTKAQEAYGRLQNEIYVQMWEDDGLLDPFPVTGTIDIPDTEIHCRYEFASDVAKDTTTTTYRDEDFSVEHEVFLEGSWVYVKTEFPDMVSTAQVRNVQTKTKKRRTSILKTTNVALNNAAEFRGNGARAVTEVARSTGLPFTANSWQLQSGVPEKDNAADGSALDQADDNVVYYGMVITSAMLHSDCKHYGCMVEITTTFELTYQALLGGRRRRLVTAAALPSSEKVSTMIIAQRKAKKGYKCQQKESKQGCMTASKLVKKGKGPVDGPCFWKKSKCYGTAGKKSKPTTTALEGVSKKMCAKLKKIGCFFEDDQCMCRE